MSVRNILTVDVEDWYHICDVESVLPPASWDRCESRVQGNVEKILSLFSRFKVRATFFILGYIAEKIPELVRTIHREGHEIACHGFSHVQVYKLTKEEFVEDLLQAKRLIENSLQDKGVKVISFRAAEWSICNGKRDSYWALDLLAENGFVYDSSVAPLRFIGIPGAPTTPYPVSTTHGTIREFPPLVTGSPFGNLPIGGGWGMRIFPYRMIQKEIRRLNDSGHPALIFCHPTDFDPCPPRIPLPWIKRFVCRGKIRTTEERFIRLLSEFEFGPLREAVLG